MSEQLILEKIGKALFGPAWQQALAKRLVVSDRSLREWLAGGRLPPGVKSELVQIARAAAANFTMRAHALQLAANELGGDSVVLGDGISSSEHGGILTDFRVIPTGSFDDPEIRFEHDGKLVLAHVTREAWEDFFRMSGGEMRSGNDARLLAQANLPRLVTVIAERYFSGKYDWIDRAGGTYPLITLYLADLERAGPGMSMKILNMARGSGFQTQVYSTPRKPGEDRKR